MRIKRLVRVQSRDRLPMLKICVIRPSKSLYNQKVPKKKVHPTATQRLVMTSSLYSFSSKSMVVL